MEPFLQASQKREGTKPKDIRKTGIRPDGWTVFDQDLGSVAAMTGIGLVPAGFEQTYGVFCSHEQRFFFDMKGFIQDVTFKRLA